MTIYQLAKLHHVILAMRLKGSCSELQIHVLDIDSLPESPIVALLGNDELFIIIELMTSKVVCYFASFYLRAGNTEPESDDIDVDK